MSDDKEFVDRIAYMISDDMPEYKNAERILALMRTHDKKGVTDVVERISLTYRDGVSKCSHQVRKEVLTAISAFYGGKR